MANLIIKPSSGGSLKLQEDGGTDALTIDASGNTTLSGTLGVTGNTTLSGSANNLGTVTTGNLSNNNIVMPRFKEISRFHYNLSSSTSATFQETFNISGSLYTSATPEHTGDIIECNWAFNMYNPAGYQGFGIQRSASTDFSSPTTQWSTGEHAFGQFGLAANDGNEYAGGVGGAITFTCAGLTADTTYYWRMVGMTHSPQTGSASWGSGTSGSTNHGVHMTLKRWSIV
jgi:hypothetical protein